MSNLERLTYRSSKQAIRFAWRTVILSIVFGSAIFIILPLTTQKPEKEEKTLAISPAPEKVKIKIPEKEKIYEKKSIAKNEEPVKKEITPVPPKAPQPPAAPVKIKLSPVSTNVALQMDMNLTPKLNFKVEKIQAFKQIAEKPVLVKKTPPVITDPGKDYNAIFSESEVDNDAVIIKKAQPIFSRRMLRRASKGQLIIKCIISKEGKVISPLITQSLQNGLYDSACLKALEQFIFRPARVDGKPVAQRFKLTFDIEIK